MSGLLFFSPATGHAYIENKGRPTHVVDLKVGELQSAQGTNIDMWMKGPGDVEQIDAGEYPFTAAIAAAMHHRRRHRVCSVLPFCLDATLGDSLRRQIAMHIEESTENAEDFAAVRAFAERMEIPTNVDFSMEFTGRVGELVAIVKRRHSAVVSRKG